MIKCPMAWRDPLVDFCEMGVKLQKKGLCWACHVCRMCSCSQRVVVKIGDIPGGVMYARPRDPIKTLQPWASCSG